VYLLATKVFDRRTGLVAGLLYGLFPEHIGFSHYLWAEILLSFLAVLSVYFLFAFLEDPGDPRRLYGSALAAGFALITKEYILLLFIGYLGAIPFLRGRFPAGEGPYRLHSCPPPGGHLFGSHVPRIPTRHRYKRRGNAQH